MICIETIMGRDVLKLDPTTATWNFFQREHEPELWCAVLAHDALPGFLLSGEWRFTGHQFGEHRAPPGFNTDAAAIAERLNGFYLFQLTNPADNYERAAS